MEAMENCLMTAKKANSPREQVENFLKHSYVPLPWQWEFHAAARLCDTQGGPTEVGAGGARGPGKSHGIFAQISLDDCLRVSNLKALFLRKTAVSAKESFDDLIEKVITNEISYERAGNVLKFNNNSRIIMGGFNNEDDIDKYVGIEYDVIVIEELNQLTKEKYEKLLGSLRTSKTNWRPRIYSSFNPGGIGHSFVKSHFVTPYRLGEQKKTRFIPATYKANPHLNPEYIDYLEGLGGDLGKAWRGGDFDLFAGQYFTEWKHEIQVCKPFTIPTSWRRFRAGDYGFNAPASVGWYAIDPSGNLYRYKELYGSGMSYSKLADEVEALTNADEEIDYEVFDPAFWAKKGERDDGLSGAEVYSMRIKELTNKMPKMVRGDNSRVVGWGLVREYIKPQMQQDKLTSKLQVFSTCTKFIETFPELQHDKRNPEDVDSDGEDHAADELRYAVMSRPTAKKIKLLTEIPNRKEANPAI